MSYAGHRSCAHAVRELLELQACNGLARLMLQQGRTAKARGVVDPYMRGSAKGWHSPILRRRRRYCVAVEGNYNAMCQNPVGSPYGTCRTRSTKMPGVTT